MPRVYISVITQRAVVKRAQGRCEYCQSCADLRPNRLQSNISCRSAEVGPANSTIWPFRVRDVTDTSTTGRKHLIPLIGPWYHYATHAGRGGKTIFVGAMTMRRLLA